MSNILYQELRSTYRWLRTFLPPVTYRARGQYRGQMRRNRVWATLFNWLLWGEEEVNSTYLGTIKLYLVRGVVLWVTIAPFVFGYYWWVGP